MRILIIGGTALVGPHLIRELSSDRATRIWTLTRAGRPYFTEDALTGDRRDAATLRDALETARPDVVVDMIPFTQADAQGLAQAARTYGHPVRLVALSSIDVYAAYGRLHGTEEVPLQPVPITETMALRQKLGFDGAAYDKLGIERIYREAFTDLTLLRLPAIYGWPDTTRVLPYLDQMLDGAETITLPADRAAFRFSRGLHKNIALAAALTVMHPGGGQKIYNVAEPRAFSELDWIRKIAAACGWRGETIVEPSAHPNTPVQHLEVASDAIRRDLGFHEKYDVDEGLADTVAFHAYQRLGKPYRKYY
ncbi:NAD(P)-dependent oxidoreductase [Ruegeria sp. HKCCD8929]|uniref:NAD-dependent epimerase/dehydratase family protein n=1 Tax=Ruegeria sp. HKCCD8929 TaxID=2683006 RepID=UPI001488632E|nr:NAD-dependent epimerase/dehydratase family protein [Ruegeria sp. HKCCD8929]